LLFWGIQALGYEDRPFLPAVIARGRKYPLYDVTVTIADMENIHAKQEEIRQKWGTLDDPVFESYKQLESLKETHIIGTFVPPRNVLLGPYPLPDNSDNRGYEIRITARNGFIAQQIHFLKVDGKWVMAEKIFKGPKAEVIQQFFDPQFPRNKWGSW
jgi:hypothetical protein